MFFLQISTHLLGMFISNRCYASYTPVKIGMCAVFIAESLVTKLSIDEINKKYYVDIEVDFENIFQDLRWSILSFDDLCGPVPVVLPAIKQALSKYISKKC